MTDHNYNGNSDILDVEGSDIRSSKQITEDSVNLGFNALTVLKRRYLLRDASGNIIETPSQLFRRVARAIALVDRKYGKRKDVRSAEETFYRMMADLKFLPNTPTLMNAGTGLGQLSACFVLPVEDNLTSIFNAVKATALIHQSGGGTGFSFSRLRPKGDIVKISGGAASGPVSFMRIFDETTEEIKQGGKRRGANMGILSVYHPDIVEFVTTKSQPKKLENFNISVAVDDDFMRAVERPNEEKIIKLVNPRNQEVTTEMSAHELFQLIATKAWETGDPGLVFLDEINRHNPTPKVGKIEATNPCGEMPLLPYESCNLGSINLSKFVEDANINWKELATVIKGAVHFLDNVIDANKYTVAETRKITRANRKIGLGVMGFAEALIKLGIRYDSEECLSLARKIMRFIQEKAHEASKELGRERGSFPNFKESIWNKERFMRNATVTTIAPTGTISIIAGCSSGIEPLFAVSFMRDVMEGTNMLEVNTIFEQAAKANGFFSTELMSRVAESGSVKEVDQIPRKFKDVFTTALDISPEWHVKVQAAFQKYTDNAVSKTVNLRKESTIEDVKKAYLLAWRLKCKGITVYRYGSKQEQVLYLGESKRIPKINRRVIADSEFAGGCSGSVCPF